MQVEEKCDRRGYRPARREGAREGLDVLLDYRDRYIQHQDDRNLRPGTGCGVIARWRRLIYRLNPAVRTRAL